MKRILCLRIETDALQTVAARCKQFTPLVGIDADVFPQSVLLDITNVVHLFGGEAALVQRIIDELHAEGWQLRAALAGTPGAAWALASYGREREKGRKGEREKESPPTMGTWCPPFSLSPLLSSLPLEALRLPEPTVALLHSLGVWRIEELEALPRRELSSRFGPELLDCLDRVTGRLPEPLPAWDSPPPLEVRWSAEFPTTRRETLEAALEGLARRLAAMLMRAGRGATRLECLLQCTVGGRAPCTAARNESPLGTSGRQVVVGLFRPSAWANHLVELLQVRFESLQLPGPVDSVRLAATCTAPLEVRQQEMFFGHHVPMVVQTRVQPQDLSGLIDRLSNRLGHARVMRVRLIPDAQPELACHYTPLVLGRAKPRPSGTSASPMPSPLVPRPLRLLAQPVRLPGGGHHLPMVGGQFSFAGRPGTMYPWSPCTAARNERTDRRIVRCVGPERIETGWWRGGHHVPSACSKRLVGVARDYYRIETADGRCYWVFRRLPTGPWFLHGTFD